MFTVHSPLLVFRYRPITINSALSRIPVNRQIQVGMCRKPKFCSNSVFKNRTVQKFEIRSDGFPIETACNQPFK